MKLDMNKFSEIINDFLTENEVHMLLTMPKGTQDVMVQDNTDCGPVMQFYFILAAVVSVCKAMRELLGIDANSEEWENTVDTMLDMVRKEILPNKNLQGKKKGR